jgi:hypothetical protein
MPHDDFDLSDEAKAAKAFKALDLRPAPFMLPDTRLVGVSLAQNLNLGPPGNRRTGGLCLYISLNTFESC